MLREGSVGRDALRCGSELRSFGLELEATWSLPVCCCGVGCHIGKGAWYRNGLLVMMSWSVPSALLCALLCVDRERQMKCALFWVASGLCQMWAGGALGLARLLLRRWVSGWEGGRVEAWTTGDDVLVRPVRAFVRSVRCG